jgi:signal transduction histidine kinase
MASGSRDEAETEQDMPNALRLLIVEDMPDDAELLLLELKRGDWEIVYERVETAAAMAEALDSRYWDIIISDYSMPHFSGLEALALARRHAPDLPFILVSGSVGEDIAVEVMKAGANDYLLKGNYQRLRPAVERELRDAAVRREARAVEQELERRDRQLAEAQRLAQLGSWHIDFRLGVVICAGETCQILDSHNQTTTIEEFVSRLQPDDRSILQGDLYSPEIKEFARDYRIILTNGAVRFIHLKGDIVRDGTGKPLEAGGMIQDITERKNGESQLQRAHDELAAAGKAKDHFLAILSHELRTPLTPILALISLWQKKRDLPDDLRSHLDTMQRSVHTEVHLIDDLLDLTSIVNNQLELHPEALDIHALLQKSIEAFQKQIDAKGLKVTFALKAKEHHVLGDPVRLQQVFRNVIANATKFTSTGGKVLVETENDGANRIKVKIIDDGVGIEKEVLPRLFHRFEQGETTLTRRFGGLGVGLSISKSLMELHRGKIEVSSKGRNAGTTVCIELDTAEAPDPPTSTDGSFGSFNVHGSNVLLVEDHKDTQLSMVRLLNCLECNVTTAGTVAEAVALANGQEFDLLISDLDLPDGNGTEVMKAFNIRQHKKGIAISGFGQDEVVKQCREAGFSAHLTKPIDMGRLAGAIEMASEK